jgi:hypothetical protein
VEGERSTSQRLPTPLRVWRGVDHGAVLDGSLLEDLLPPSDDSVLDALLPRLDPSLLDGLLPPLKEVVFARNEIVPDAILEGFDDAMMTTDLRHKKRPRRVDKRRPRRIGRKPLR